MKILLGQGGLLMVLSVLVACSSSDSDKSKRVEPERPDFPVVEGVATVDHDYYLDYEGDVIKSGAALQFMEYWMLGLSFTF